MLRHHALVALTSVGLLITGTALPPGTAVQAQTPQQIPVPQPSPASAAAQSPATDTASDLLSEDELEVLVARIALYPDELVALISAASLYPLQIVEASRFLDERAKNDKLEPKSSWDGSIISLLNYPQIVKMMSDDLDWTQSLAAALGAQQKDVLVAIQQLRAEAQAAGIIKSDDKIQVVEENDSIVIKPAKPDVVYIPQYPPEMLYVPDYQPVPISYYPDPYPIYYSPGATFFAGVVTGVIWGAVIDWNRWGVWGGRWNGGNVNINCNRCLNNVDFNGKINIGDVDWRNVDRSKISFDKTQLGKIDRTNLRNNIEANKGNNIGNRASSLARDKRPGTGGGNRTGQDVRKSTLEGLKAKPGTPTARTRPAAKPAQGNVARKGGQGARPKAANTKARSKAQNRAPGKARPAARVDRRPKNPSGLGQVRGGRAAGVHSNRGRQSMGGGQRGGNRAHRTVQRGGGGRRR